MGSYGSKIQLEDSDLEDIEKETGFTKSQIKRLYSRFSNLDKGMEGRLSRNDFLRIPEFSINPLSRRLLDLFFIENGDTDGCNFRQFVRTLARFRPETDGPNPLNTREEKLRFAFKIYDVNNDGKISQDNIVKILEMMVGECKSGDQLRAIAERTLMESDMDKDGYIDFPEFKKVMELTDFQSKMSIRFAS